MAANLLAAEGGYLAFFIVIDEKFRFCYSQSAASYAAMLNVCSLLCDIIDDVHIRRVRIGVLQVSIM